MKAIFSTLLIILAINFSGFAQQKQVFNPKADGISGLNKAIENAYEQKKHVLVKVGYNQCPWCLILNEFIKKDEKIDSLINADYVFVKVNYNKENYNMEAMKKLGFPQRFGFPVLVVLDQHGNRIHTQNTLYLEKGKSYDKKRIINFLKGWNKKAIAKESYEK